MDIEKLRRKHSPSLKRNEKYHEQFKSIPKNEKLEYSGSCLLNDSSKYYQGRVYVSMEHICFISKSFFGKLSIIVHMKNVIDIELKTHILLQECLNIITYDKTYSLRAMSFKDGAYPILLHLWQHIMGLPSTVQSVFQTDLPRPSETVQEDAIIEEERVYGIPVREMVRLLTSESKAREFYSTLTDEPVSIHTYVNRRTIQFANEFIDEVYRVQGSMLAIEHQSRGTLCKIYIFPFGRSQTRVRIVEKYNYTTQHYFEYLACLVSSKSPPSSGYVFLSVYVGLLLLKAGSFLFRQVFPESTD
ncbi:hypothetical protein NECID01_1933 [Nematocida sp. AWRm77]|nr:hypothetical protein NECID01_1933 [Nematocida sp. AWRm77]